MVPTANRINSICKEIHMLGELQILPPPISAQVIAAIRKGYKDKASIAKLKGKAKTNFAIDILICLLVKAYGRQFVKISKLLEDSGIVSKDESYSSDALRVRYNRIKQDDMIKQYVNFFDASRKSVVTQQGGPDTSAAIAVYWELPFQEKIFKE